MRIKAWYKEEDSKERELVEIVSVEYHTFDQRYSFNEASVVIFINSDQKICSDVSYRFTVLTEEELEGLETERQIKALSEEDKS